MRFCCVLLVCSTCFHIAGFAQDSPMDLKKKECTNYLYFGISSLIYNKLHFSNEGVSHVYSKRLLSPEINLGYRNRIGNFWEWNADLSVGVIPFSFGYDFPAPDSSIFQVNNPVNIQLSQHNREYISPNFYFAVSPNIGRSFALKEKFSLFFNVGGKIHFFRYDQVQINMGSGIYIDSANTNLKELFDISLRDTVSNEMNLSLRAEIGIELKLKKQHNLRMSFVLNWSPVQRLHGWYDFSNLGYLSKGSLTQGINHFGIRLNYSIPLSRSEHRGE